MPRRRHRAARWLALVGLGRALGDTVLDDDLWTVSCNTDCDGVDTCAERHLCVGEETQTSVCSDNPRCPASERGSRCSPKPCVWGQWSAWWNDGVSGLCSRNRSFAPNRCGGHPCMGSTSETVYCEPKRDPPQDCQFSQWSEWRACDSQTLQRTRERAVKTPAANGGRACDGHLSETEGCGERHAPVDCELADWMSWSGCTRSCGGGQQTRVRAVLTQALHDGRLCQGEGGEAVVLQVTQSCNNWECAGDTRALNCQLGPWSEWSDCSGDEQVLSEWEGRGVSAAKTQKFRQREIAAPASQGGLPCHDKLEETAPCKNFASDAKVLVKSDCQLSEWASWTLCDRTCDGGQTFRKRTVELRAQNGGAPCEDLTSETMPCNEIPCSVSPEGSDCQPSQWSEWSPCSAMCGEGVEERRRHILVPAAEGGRGCNDILAETRPCEHIEPCTQTDCAWKLWTEWSTCTRTCNGGQRYRRRDIAKKPAAGGASCHAYDSISEVEACADTACPREECVDGKWGEWSSWGICTESCGGGLRWRHRQIVTQASKCGKAVSGIAEDFERCNLHTCDGDRDCDLASWTMWSACSRSCNGVQSRTRRIATMGTGSGRRCGSEEGDKGTGLEEVRSCNAPNELMLQAQAPGFADIIQACGYGEPVDCQLGSWSAWSRCTATCGGGDRTRNRTIVQQPSNGGQPCGGVLGQIGICNMSPCEAPRDCRWSDWSDWGSCSHCDGEKIRFRAIFERGNTMGKPCKHEAAKEVAQCNECDAEKTFWCVWADWTASACSSTCGPGLQRRTRELLKTETAPANLSDAIGNVTGEGATCSGTETDYEPCPDPPVCTDGCQPVDCTFSQWTEWTEASCNGICRRHRNIEQQANKCGQRCDGLLESTKTCPSHCEGDSDCQMSAWSEWSTCQYNGGQRTRNRRILAVPGPFGEACSGNLQETKPCKGEDPEPEGSDCVFRPWGEWTECSTTCGGGQRERRRDFLSEASGGGEACAGAMSMTAACGSGDCPVDVENVDCVIGQWSEWAGCEGSDNLQAYRTRSLTPAQGKGLPCEGALKEMGDCPKPEPLDCTFEPWAPWGDCGASCGGGQRFRTRQVAKEAQHGGRPCEGFLDQSEPCNEVPCNADLDCAVSPWGKWSTCDMKCGTGVQKRERKVERGAGPGGAGCSMGLKEVRGCQGSDCAGDQDCLWSAWQEWGGCERAEYCGMGVRKRSRDIAVYPQGQGRLCDPLSREEVMPSSLCVGNCDRKVCIDGEWGEWGPWGSCSVTCGGGGVRMRSRWETARANYCGRPAQGDQQRFETCSAAVACEAPDHAEDCGFSNWGPWERECSSWCNGIRTRSRGYSLPSGGGKPCRGATMQSVRCNPGPGEQPPVGCESGEPVDCEQSEWGQWSECAAKCGPGHRTRRRQVLQPPSFGGKACENPFEEIDECNAALPCPDASVDCAWGEWEAWASCNPVLGQRERVRHVKQPKMGMGVECEGPRKQVGGCQRDCPDRQYFCLWSEWLPWSSCSTTCGSEGRVTRKRSLTLSPLPPGGEESRDLSSVNSKVELLRERLTSASWQRQQELMVAFASGLLSLAVILGGSRRFARRLRSSGEPQAGAGEGGASGRRALVAADLELQT